MFEDVRIGPSPLWLKQRLMAAGQRPISNVVDITNYVMLTTAQPLHAFDLDKVRGQRIDVRRAREGERMVTLDDAERVFGPDMALVCDAEGPSGIAGIMGGQVSEVADDTTRVLMEAATWVGPNIMRTSKALGLRTEASARFEKQLHPEQAIAAQRLAARLMVELCGARLVPGTVDVYPHPAQPRVVPLRRERIARLLGTPVDDEAVDGILHRLGFEWAGEGWRVPPWRDSDVQREADLIEEVARVHGLDKLPTTLPARRAAVGRLTPSQRLRRRLEDLLRDRGLHECISYAFVSPRALDALRLGDEPVLRLENPLSEDQSVMRPLLLPGPARRGPPQRGARPARGRAVRVGPRLPPGRPARARAGRVAGGRRRPRSRGSTWPCSRPRRCRAGGARNQGRLTSSPRRRCWRPCSRWRTWTGASRRADSRSCTLAGRPRCWPASTRSAGSASCTRRCRAAWDLGGSVAGFELDVDALVALAAGEEPRYHDVTSFPAVLQDIAVGVPVEVSAAAAADTIRSAAGELLANVELFDVYSGDQVGEAKKSLAFRLRFQAPDRTLTDEEVAELRAAIEAALVRAGRAAACLSTGWRWSARAASAARSARGWCTGTRRWSSRC